MYLALNKLLERLTLKPAYLGGPDTKYKRNSISKTILHFISVATFHVLDELAMN